MINQTCLYFLKTGLQTSIQDFGRVGYQKFGLPVGGVMDKFSSELANKLVGNPRNTPVLEITLLGPKINILAPCQIALTGANLSAQLDQLSINRYETITIRKASQICFGRVVEGCRAYLAVRGKWMIDKYLTSYSYLTFLQNNTIQKGFQLRIKYDQFIKPIKYKLSNKTIAPYSNRTIIHLTEGPEFNKFSNSFIAHFFSQTYRLATDSNRMGYRLEPAIKGFNSKESLISSGVIPGTIQISSAGQPIILMADAQTIGGYFRIGIVIEKDLDQLAQLKPGDYLSFKIK